MSKKTSCLAVAAIATALVVTGCSSKASKGATAHVGAASGTKVSIMVGGLNPQTYLPFMLAQQLGQYNAHGANITPTPNPPGYEPM